MRKVIFIFLILFLFFLPLESRAISIEVLGDWKLNITENDMERDSFKIKSRYFSDAFKLIVSGANGNWRVDVKRIDSYWHKDLVLKVRKTSGSSRPEVVIGDTSREFFSGKGNVIENIQLILENVSLKSPPGIYSTKLIYTVSE